MTLFFSLLHSLATIFAVRPMSTFIILIAVSLYMTFPATVVTTTWMGVDRGYRRIRGDRGGLGWRRGRIAARALIRRLRSCIIRTLRRTRIGSIILRMRPVSMCSYSRICYTRIRPVLIYRPFWQSRRTFKGFQRRYTLLIWQFVSYTLCLSYLPAFATYSTW